MRKVYLKMICTVLLSVLGAAVMAQTIRYAKPEASGGGTSWADAGDLQALINSSAANDEVWVAAGVYKPTEKLDAAGSDRDKTFILRAGVKIYGGFAGNESLLAERDVTANLTILSGDIDDSNSASSGDCYHVAASAGNSDGAVLDGFTIQHGFANVASELAGTARNQGAGINITNEETSVTFRNLVIKDNQSSVNASPINNGGAGVYLKLSGNSNCVFENVVFDGNTAAASGGNLYFTSVSGSPTVTIKNSKVFKGTGTSGAGIYVLGSSGKAPQLEVFNTIFSGNRASSSPGGAAVFLGTYSTAAIVNCTFYNNSNPYGIISYSNSSTVALNLYNSIFNGNTLTISNTNPIDLAQPTAAILDLRSNLFQVTPPEDGSAEYKNIINNTPANLFLSTDISSANFLQLVEGTATEKGDNTFITTYGLTTDLAGNPRITHTNTDLGAYEYQGTLPIELISFSARKVNNGAELHWQAASEIDNEKFVIERSSDGNDFKVISGVQSKGDTKQTVFYSYVDNSPLKGNNYYRLSQTDKNGVSRTLGIRVLNFDLQKSTILVYPNPAVDIVRIKVGSVQADAINIHLVSLSGTTLLSKKIDKLNAEQGFDLEVSRFKSGNYALIVDNGKTTGKTKLTIVK